MREFKKNASNRIFLSLTILLFIFIGIMRYLDGFLTNEIAPNGIVSFELAKKILISSTIINSWNETAKTAAGISIGLDFIFLLVYSLFIAVCIRRLNNRLWQGYSFYIVGNVLVIAIFLAALFDVIENIALIKILLGDLRETWSNMAYYFASVKFIFILCCVLYILVNLMILPFKKSKHA